jgi:hypothetical protein
MQIVTKVTIKATYLSRMKDECAPRWQSVSLFNFNFVDEAMASAILREQ